MAKKGLRRGIFITFEGPEGCGKSTQSRLLYSFLKKSGKRCVYTREPGGTKTGEMIRKVLLNSKGINISNLAETLLFEASRAQIVNEVISPALRSGKIVICDRYSDSTLCYQGYGGKVPVEDIESIDRISTGGLKPDLTILLDIDTVTGLKRARRKGVDRMEEKTLAYHKRVRMGYLKLAGKYPKRIRLVKVRENIESTQKIVRGEVASVV
ncbi:MAG TPA: dTMP kinase [Candidatus Omnitrophota bacterium]|nr:dTMP kinase [Candidatus Omnitrophota bacterium]